MPAHKNYDDDQLVDLLAAGELRQKAIAETLEVSRQHVCSINRGLSRPELQPRIVAARKAYRAQKKRLATTLARQAARQSVPHTFKHKDYDDDLLVELIASGRYNHAQIARKVGLGRTHVRDIARGSSRPELQPRIRKVMLANQQAARREGAAWLRDMIRKHISQGLNGNDDVARRCRNDAIGLVWIDESCDELSPGARVPGGLADLPEPLKSEVLQVLGGPEEE